MPPGQKKRNEATVEIDEDKNPEYVIVPPDGGWGWVVVVGALYLNTLVDGVFYTFSIFLQDLSDYFQADKSTISLIFSILFGTHFGMGVICAGLSNTFGLRPVTCAGSLIAASAFALSSIVEQYELLFLTYGFLGGVGLGLMITNGLLAPTLYFERRRGLAISITSLGTGFGAIVFPYIGNHIRKIATWQTVFQFQAIAIATVFFAGLTFRPIKPTRVVTTEDVQMNVIEKRVSRSTGRSSGSSYPDEREDRVSEKEPTIYMKKTLYEQGQKSAMSLHMHTQVAENIGAQAVYSRNFRRGPSCCERCGEVCCNRERSPEEVLVVHPDTKSEFFVEESAIRIRKPRQSMTSTITHKSKYMSTATLGTLQPSTYVYSKVFPTSSKKRNKCAPMADALKNMLDCRAFRSPAYVLFAISGVVFVGGLLIVVAFQPDRAELQGFDQDTATYFVMTFGAANCVWRLLLGVLTLLPKSHDLFAHVCCILIGGIACLVSGASLSLPLQYFWAVAYGLPLASLAVHRPLIMMDLVGLDKITAATGIQYMLFGVAALMAPPLSGLAMEMSENIDVPYYIAGILLTTSGLATSFVKCISRREKQLQRTEDDVAVL